MHAINIRMTAEDMALARDHAARTGRTVAGLARHALLLFIAEEEDRLLLGAGWPTSGAERAP